MDEPPLFSFRMTHLRVYATSQRNLYKLFCDQVYACYEHGVGQSNIGCDTGRDTK